MIKIALATAISAPIVLWTLAVNASEVTIRVENVRTDRGFVFASICRSEEFLKTRCLHSSRVEAKPPAVSINFPDVRAGSYAIQVFHDENGDEKHQLAKWRYRSSPRTRMAE